MRVTQSMLANNMMKNLSNSYQSLGVFQDQLASGKKINRPSDDPVVAMKGMNYRTDVTEIKQYQRNLSSAYNWMENTDSAYDKATSSLQRIRELVVQASNDSYDSSQRQLMSSEVRELIEHLESIANTKVSNKYIFNGTDTTRKPINLEGIDVSLKDLKSVPKDFVITYEGRDFTYNQEEGKFINGSDVIDISVSDSSSITLNDTLINETDLIFSKKDSIPSSQADVKFEVSKGINIVVNSLPNHAFSTEFFSDLKKVFRKMNDPATNGNSISEQIGQVDKHLHKLLGERSEIGARFNRIELIEDRLSAQEIIANKMLSENEDIDVERVITELKTQESIHRATLAVGAKVIQPSLMDFLR